MIVKYTLAEFFIQITALDNLQKIRITERVKHKQVVS